MRAVRAGHRVAGLGPSTDFSFHVAWLPTGRYGIEDLGPAGELPPKGETLVVGARRLLCAGSGGPARILGLV